MAYYCILCKRQGIKTQISNGKFCNEHLEKINNTLSCNQLTSATGVDECIICKRNGVKSIATKDGLCPTHCKEVNEGVISEAISYIKNDLCTSVQLMTLICLLEDKGVINEKERSTILESSKKEK